MSDQNSSNPPPTILPIVMQQSPAPSQQSQGSEGKKELIQLTSKQLEKRLAEERDKGSRKVLKDLGIDKENREEAMEQVRKGLMSLTKREQVEAEQAKALEELKAKATQADELQPLVLAFANKEFDSLPEAAQKYVATQAGDSPLARYKAIEALKKSGMLDLLGAGAPKAPEAPAEIKPPKPATTVAGDPPTAPKTGADMDEYQTWQALREAGRSVEAANYLNMRRAKVMALASKYAKK